MLERAGGTKLDSLKFDLFIFAKPHLHIMTSAAGKFKDELIATARTICTAGKGIAAFDESQGTAGKRLAQINVENTEENRRVYRELLLTSGDGELACLAPQRRLRRAAAATPPPAVRCCNAGVAHTRERDASLRSTDKRWRASRRPRRAARSTKPARFDGSATTSARWRVERRGARRALRASSAQKRR